MDYREIVTALEGTASSTELIRSQYGSYMKAGYAPLSGAGRASEFVVAVEASPSFLENLDQWRASLLITSLLLAGGIVVSVILVIKSTESLIRARESLIRSETLAAMGRMTAVITHEIRNPLFIIRSSAEKLKDAHPDESAEIDEFIIEEVDRLDRVLTDYLSFSRGRGIEKKRIDLEKVLKRSIKSIGKSLHDEDVIIETELNTGRAPFTGDAKKLLQAFMNIMLNSIQAMEGKGRIGVYMDRTSGFYRIVFSDDGPGISDRETEKVFEPFYTTRPQGSGLGLSVVRECVIAHGGSVELSGNAGRGTVVTINLPAEYTTEPGEENEQGPDS
jgi:signal transduction histidine kinase